MSIESANKFVEIMKNDTEFSLKVLACESVDERIKLLENEGYKFTIAEIMKEIRSADHQKMVKENNTDVGKWLEIVAVWSIDKRKGWRGDLLDRSVRSFLDATQFEIACPNCSQCYFVTKKYSGKDLECEVCGKLFTIDLTKTPANSENSKQASNSEYVTGSPIVPKNNIWKNWK